MLDALSRIWRIFATGLSFAVFGAGGLVLRLLVFPLLNLAVRQPKRRTTAARAVVRFAFLGFVALMNGLGVLRYEVVGRERLERHGLLILANHPTLIDTVFLLAFVRQAGCVVKGALWRNPFTRGPISAAGYLNNDKGLGLLDDCIAALEDGENLIIFPEGTRTPADGAVQMKRGAANVAVRGARDVTPVVISCEPATLCKGEKWWQVPPRRAQFRIEVREDIRIAEFIGEDVPEAMAARRLTKYLEEYFTEGRRQHAGTGSQGTDHRRAAA
ncbi:MAG: 1-acyl-sn-glycerol-3-phosphate acyltransferase [Burkholderiaceae bacterium]|nr:1-acyl-sn-glycerol-3-phosphate acyltransferase [Burkholderiaceae bacterium]